MKRATVMLLAAVGAGVTLGSGPAGAGTVNGETVVTSHPRPGGGYVLEVTAATGQVNGVSWLGQSCDVRDGQCLAISDDVGITDDSPKCDQVNATEVQCTVQRLRRLKVDTGNQADQLVGTNYVQYQFATVAHTGAGADRLALSGDDLAGDGFCVDIPVDSWVIARSGAGNDHVELACSGTARGGGGEDRLIGRRSNQQLYGGRHADRITGGRGNNDHCDGQAGDDSGGDGCETTISL